ncbi:MAG: hypothetical protein K2M64_01410, partial [Clostridia bacterium]|nr:hypothetical protein [Clostridia bacterium]
MHKSWKSYFEQNNFQINGNNASGTLNGYETSFVITNNVAIHIAFYSTEEQKEAIANAVKLLADKYTQYSFDKFGLSLGITNVVTMGKTAEKSIN